MSDAQQSGACVAKWRNAGGWGRVGAVASYDKWSEKSIPNLVAGEKGRPPRAAPAARGARAVAETARRAAHQ